MTRPIEFYDIETGWLQRESHERFGMALDLAQSGFQELYDEGRICGALLFGSAVFGDADALSDLDALVLLSEWRRPEDDERIRDVARRTYAATGVPIELSAFMLDDLTRGRHPYRAHMVAWLEEQAALFPENCIGNPRLYSIKTSEVNLATDLNGWLDGVLYQLKKQNFQGHSFRPEDMLAFVLNVPHVTGRKCIDVLRYSGIIPADSLASMKKADIADAVHEVLSGRAYRLRESYQELSDERNLFAKFVSRLRLDELGAEEYRQIVCETLGYDLPKAIRLVGLMRVAFNDAYLHYGGATYPGNVARRAAIARWMG
jgi:hypothetical protein